ncbi:MAG: DUF1049 domain-containing protein [Gammaproteobacteria bacterium]|nr:DUF1049 domain-containing protein [Gammaproteobacteria bacterium]
MKRIFLFVVLFLVALLGLSFALMNADPVGLSYYFGSIQAPLSLVVVLALALGAGLGVLASLGMLVNQKRELARLRRSEKMAATEVKNLRSLTLKDAR